MTAGTVCLGCKVRLDLIAWVGWRDAAGEGLAAEIKAGDKKKIFHSWHLRLHALRVHVCEINTEVPI